MKKTKFTALFMLLVIVSTFLTGCVSVSGMYSKLKYGAKMYSKCNEWLLPSFLDEHKLLGVAYKNPDYVEGVDDYSEQYYTDYEAPINRTFIVNDEEAYDKIFKENTLKVDFDEEIVFLYIFADCSPSQKYIIDDISVESEKVSIYFQFNSNFRSLIGYIGSTSPYPRCLVVKMDKIDVDNVEFIKVKRSSIL